MEMSEAGEDAERAAAKVSEEQYDIDLVVKQWFKEYPKMADYKAAEQGEQGMDEDALDWPDHMIEAGARAAWENWGGHGGAVRMVLEGGGSTWDKLSKIERAELKSDFAAGLNIVARSVKLVEEQAREEERIKTWEDAAVLMRSVIHTWSQPGVGDGPHADPCRIRVTQEYANAFDAYAQGKGSPAIRVAKQREREKLAKSFSANLTRLEIDGKVIFDHTKEEADDHHHPHQR